MPGSVMLEGTTLSEGRGTTRPLELFGAPDLDVPALLARDARARAAVARRLPPASVLVRAHVPQARRQAVRGPAGARGGSCSTTSTSAFRPWRLFALAFKALRQLRPDYPLWRDFPYEYEEGRLAIDVINGGELLRQWVDDPAATPADLDRLALADESAWQRGTAGVAALLQRRAARRARFRGGGIRQGDSARRARRRTAAARGGTSARAAPCQTAPDLQRQTRRSPSRRAGSMRSAISARKAMRHGLVEAPRAGRLLRASTRSACE